MYNEQELDVLKEIINIGGGNAATSLAQLLGAPVHMTVPLIKMLEYTKVFEETMADEQIVEAVVVQMNGQAEGLFLFVVDSEESQNIVSVLLAGAGKDEELGRSALKEFVNIMVNSFLNAVCRLLDTYLYTSVPLLVTDMFGAVVGSAYMEQGLFDDQVLIIKNEFFYDGNRLEFSLYFVPQQGTLELLFSKLLNR